MPIYFDTILVLFESLTMLLSTPQPLPEFISLIFPLPLPLTLADVMNISILDCCLVPDTFFLICSMD